MDNKFRSNKQLALAVTLAVVGASWLGMQGKAFAAASHGEEHAPLTYQEFMIANQNGDIQTSKEKFDGTAIYVSGSYAKGLQSTTITLGGLTVEGVGGAAGRGERPLNAEPGDRPVIAGLAGGDSNIVGVFDHNVKDITINIEPDATIQAIGGSGQNLPDQQKGSQGAAGTNGLDGSVGQVGAAGTAVGQTAGGQGVSGTDGGAAVVTGIELNAVEKLTVNADGLTIVKAVGGDGADGGEGGQGGSGADGGTGGDGVAHANGALSSDRLGSQSNITVGSTAYTNISTHNGLNGLKGNDGQVGGNGAAGAVGGAGANGGNGADAAARGFKLKDISGGSVTLGGLAVMASGGDGGNGANGGVGGIGGNGGNGGNGGAGTAGQDAQQLTGEDLSYSGGISAVQGLPTHVAGSEAAGQNGIDTDSGIKITTLTQTAHGFVAGGAGGNGGVGSNGGDGGQGGQGGTGGNGGMGGAALAQGFVGSNLSMDINLVGPMFVVATGGDGGSAGLGGDGGQGGAGGDGGAGGTAGTDGADIAIDGTKVTETKQDWTQSTYDPINDSDVKYFWKDPV